MLYYLLAIASFAIFLIPRVVSQRLLFDPRIWGPTLQDLRAAIRIQNAWLWVIGFVILIMFGFVALMPVEFFVVYICMMIFWIVILRRGTSLAITQPARNNVWFRLGIFVGALYLFFHLVVGTYFFPEYPIRNADKFREATKAYREWAADVTDKDD